MLSERMLTAVVRQCTKQYLKLEPTTDQHVPAPVPGQRYMLYLHVPFCERLCPYCSFNRFPFAEERAVPYFANLRKEMLMLKDLGYDFDSVYVGGGTPTIMIDELCDTIDLARETFSIKEVSSETNPNHLIPAYLDKLQGRVQRLSVGVQSFDDDLLKQMDRYEKYGSGAEILERVREASPYFTSLNVDMIFNFPAQTEDILINDIERRGGKRHQPDHVLPLMASPSVARSLARTVGKVDYAREQRFYHIIDELLAGGDDPLFDHGSAWTFNKRETAAASGDAMIDEYVVDYEEYPRHRVRRHHLFGQQPVRQHVFRERLQRGHRIGPHVAHGQDHVQQARPHAVPLHDAAVRPAAGQAPVQGRLRLHGGGRPAGGDGVHARRRRVRPRRCGRGYAHSHAGATSWWS